ncbi:MAG: helix-turn-helix domain-containing protein [Alsobacter sp.]
MDAGWSKCPTSAEPLVPDDIRGFRDRANMSQSVFAKGLNVTTSLASQWERGEKRPGGPSLKLQFLARRKGIDAILQGSRVIPALPGGARARISDALRPG